MNKIISKRFYSENVAEIVVEAPLIARSRKAGHFVIVRVDEHGERMPLTISDADVNNGTITLVVQRIGVSSSKLCNLEAGDSVSDLVGPLGKATDIRMFGTVVCACGGVGAAPMLPIAQALKLAGNRVITVLAARNKDLIILYDQLSAVSDEVIVMTDDGSLGQKGLVTEGVEQVINREHVDKCVTIGPAVMMKFVALTTKKYGIPTDASLNTIMVDGTGMCGACRVTVGGKTKFVCVDGPEFDAHEVDFNEMLSRLGQYKSAELVAYETYHSHSTSTLEEYDNACEANIHEIDTKDIVPFVGTAKDRVAIPRVKMNELDPKVRVQSLYDEVNQGLTFEQAVMEAHRCLNCKKPTCVDGCPVNINIPGFIKQLEIGNVIGAAEVISESSTLPAVCGRVCPQEKQCEAQCIHLKMGHEPAAIGSL
jgi:glutamate synthase (NADPH/NADH) small chain